jgi:predicted PhzF superfamily epimerase YddE/YHI9
MTIPFYIVDVLLKKICRQSTVFFNAQDLTSDQMQEIARDQFCRSTFVTAIDAEDRQATVRILLLQAK